MRIEHFGVSQIKPLLLGTERERGLEMKEYELNQTLKELNKLKVEHEALLNDYSQLQTDLEYMSKQLQDERNAATESEEVGLFVANIYKCF